MNLIKWTTLFFLASFVVAGCSTVNKPTTDDTEPAPPARQHLSNKPLVISPTLEEKEEDKITRPFTPETMYALLVAEMAAKHNRLDVTLGQYTQQAHITRDPQVVARANRLAKYMNAKQAILDTGLLWVEIEPDSQEARQTAATALIHYGHYNDALQHIDALLNLNVDVNFDYLVKTARQLDSVRRDELAKAFAPLTEKHPIHPQSWFTYALLLQLNQQLPEALDATERALELYPDYVSAKITKAKLLNALNKQSEAIKFLSKAVKAHPDHTRLRIVYAQLLIADNEIEKAQIEFSRLVEKSPDNADLIFSLALLYLENKLYDDAEKYLRRLLELDQRVADADFYLANIYRQKENYNQAIHHLEKIASGTHLLNARIQIASILFEQEQIQQARQSLSNDRDRYPQFKIQLYLAEGDLLAQNKIYTDALDILNGALNQHPENTAILYSRAMVSEKLDQLDQLERDLRLIISKEPNNAAALNALGYTLADRTNRHAEALQYITKALQLTPNDPAVIDSMGWVQYRLGNNEEALKHLREAIKLLPDHEVAAHLGEVLWVSGQQEEAKKVWNKALEKQKDSEILKAIMEKFIPAGEK